MSKLDELYEHALRDYEARQSRKGIKCVGSRDDMQTIKEWHSYNMTYKPIPYSDYLKMRVDQMNGDAPKLAPIWQIDLPS